MAEYKMTDSNNGYVLWITGLSGAGKTTVARGVINALRKINVPCVFLDGDEMRSILSSKWGYKSEDRLELAHVYSKLCRHLASSGINVVIATVAMFEDVRQWNRDNMPSYMEVYLRVPVDILIKRDVKGLYKKFANDSSSESVLSDAFELPSASDIVIDNYGHCSPEDAEWKIVNTFLQKLVYGSPVLENEKQRARFKAGIVDYWNYAYAHNSTPTNPTSFAHFCMDNYIMQDNHILEFGCGNGRDSFYFAQTNLVTALDPSSVAINSNKQRTLNTSIDNNIEFMEGAFGEISLPLDNQVDVIYSRFVMHAMNEESENMAIQEAASLLKRDCLLLLEFRTIKDEMMKMGFVVGNHEMVTDHYRRFIDTQQFTKKLVSYGFELIYFIEANGLSKLGDDDPVVARIAARKV
jgi:adenylylsulfate kinase-like enzyme/ubiquinone/menaquinone biosynthesis C-methylase UbiE